MGYTRLAAGAHYLTDVAEAAIIVCDSQIYLHKSFDEDIKEHGADFRTVFFIQ